jgi:hypothetical protein
MRNDKEKSGQLRLIHCGQDNGPSIQSNTNLGSAPRRRTLFQRIGDGLRRAGERVFPGYDSSVTARDEATDSAERFLSISAEKMDKALSMPAGRRLFDYDQLEHVLNRCGVAIHLRSVAEEALGRAVRAPDAVLARMLVRGLEDAGSFVNNELFSVPDGDLESAYFRATRSLCKMIHVSPSVSEAASGCRRKVEERIEFLRVKGAIECAQDHPPKERMYLMTMAWNDAQNDIMDRVCRKVLLELISSSSIQAAKDRLAELAGYNFYSNSERRAEYSELASQVHRVLLPGKEKDSLMSEIGEWMR